ncbi:MAG: zinc-binding dehydrogenase [Planctomycetes bacterium]|nr:zinc-binding dehydrogenase [Planctomycetota bacterium]
MPMMKAVVKIAPKDGATEIVDKPPPTPGPGDVVIKVKATGICGTDRHIWHWDPSVQFMQTPVTYGHEFCGHVAAFGKDVVDLKEGDYVSAEMHVVCGTCFQCRTGRGHICSRTKIYGLHHDGCFADYVKVPASNVLKLPGRITPRVGGFLDALGNATHTALAADLVGRKIAITGCGPIGAMAGAVCEFAGASELFLIDVSDQALKRSRNWAAMAGRRIPVTVIDTRGEGAAKALALIRERTGDGVDAVLEMSGAEPAINFALEIVRPGGQLCLLGLTSKKDVTIKDYSKNVVFKGVQLQAIIGRKMYGTWYSMLGMLEAGLDVEPIVTAEYDLTDFAQAMATFDRGETWKVVLYPEGKPAKGPTRAA